METIAIIHIYTTAVQMIQIRLNKNKAYTLVEEYKESINISKQLDSNGNITSDSISSLVNILRNFKNICDAKKVSKIIVVGTEALRCASNRDIIVDLIRKKVGIDVDVISEEKQCYYDYLAISGFTGYENGVIFDLSGGSFQLVQMKNRQMENFASFSHGAVKLEKIMSNPSLSDQEKNSEIISLAEKTAEEISWIKDMKNFPIIGMGRILRKIGKVDMVLEKYPLDIIHGYTIPLERLEALYKSASSISVQKWQTQEFSCNETQESFLASLLFTITFLKKIDAKELALSGKSLKEGAFYNYLLTEKNLIIRSPLMHSIENILKIMELDTLHAFQIRWLAMEIFSNIKDCLGFEDVEDIDLYKVVNTSALLHDSGVIINYYNHHHHSFWVILNSPICGLTHKELLMSAYIASFHRKNNSYIDFEKYSYLLNEKDIEIIRKLGVLLKLSESLDKRMDNVVKNIDFTITDKEVIMEMSASTYPDMELRDAEMILSEFQRVIGKELILK